MIPKIAEELKRRAQDLKWSGDYAGALRLRLELEELLQKLAADVQEQIKNLNMMANVAVHAGELAQAERAARKCLELCALPPQEMETLATYHMMLSCVLATQGKFEEAVKYGDQAVILFKQTPNHPPGDSFIENSLLDIERMRNHDTGPYLDKS